MIYLLDVNALLAYTWREHIHHKVVKSWCAKNLDEGFATCPLTEIGFVRLSSNARILNRPMEVPDAIETLSMIHRRPNPHFWPDSIPFAAPDLRQRLRGHNEINDAYLLLLARHHGGVLATLDRGANALGSHLKCPVQLISPV